MNFSLGVRLFRMCPWGAAMCRLCLGRRSQLVFVSVVILFALYIHSEVFIHGPYHGRLVSVSDDEIPALDPVAPAFLVDTPACRIPALNLWDGRVLPFDILEGKYCKLRPDIANLNDSVLFVVRDAMDAYNITDPVLCAYAELFHQEDDKWPFDIVSSKSWTLLGNEVSVEGMEFLRVKCSNDSAFNNSIFEAVFSFVPRKAHVEERCRNLSVGADRDALSVLVLVRDDVSRLNLYRQMPKTIQRLRELNALEMLGFNKVGEDTLPNLVPLLSGMSEEELTEKCRSTDGRFPDKCRFVWDDFRDAGYRTAYGDVSRHWSVFDDFKGFYEQSVDYYLNPFFRWAYETMPYINHLTSEVWLGPHTPTKLLLDYVAKFSLEFKSSFTYGIFMEPASYNGNLNCIRYSDDLHVSLLNQMEKNGVLERLAILFLSDEGLSYGETYQGRMEERLPFSFLVLPAWFRDRYAAAVANAGLNTRRLTTHFDVHETMLDLMRPTQRLTQEAVQQRSLALTADPTRPLPRAISLFLQIPPNRTCEDAGIIRQWCSCRTFLPVDKGAAIVTKTAETLVDHINMLVRPFRKCSQLHLDTVKSIRMEVIQDTIDRKDERIHIYILVVTTRPGNAIFEGTVRHERNDNYFDVPDHPMRLNSYRNQSFCVYNRELKPYCICRT